MKLATITTTFILIATAILATAARAQTTPTEIGTIGGVKTIGTVGTRTITGGGGVAVAESLQELREIHAALQEAVKELNRHARAKDIPREKFEKMKALLVARARAAAEAATVGGPGIQAMLPPTGWTAEFYRALTRLEAEAKKDKLTREEFEVLKKQLLLRLAEAQPM